MKFQIKGCFDGLVKVEVEIECSTTDSHAVKLGKAILAARRNGADLGGANLYGADLRGADLGGADLGGANLRGANLYGADLGGDVAKIKKLLSTILRSDGYVFIGFLKADDTLGIVAGCQNRTLASYRKHVRVDYHLRENGKALAKETTAILDCLAAMHKLVRSK